MKQNDHVKSNPRRNFLAKMVTGVTFFGIASVLAPLKTFAKTTDSEVKLPVKDKNNAEVWFDKITGKHKIVFDVSKPESIFLTFMRTFMETNNETGSLDSELNAVIVFRHAAIILALGDAVWSKYKLGETFNIKDEATKEPFVRNIYWNPKNSDPFPSEKSIGSLQKRGVMFCICDTAIENISERIAQLRDLKKSEVKKDFYDNVLPNIQIVPSGVWAIGRAQEHGCAYCLGN